MVKDLEFAIGKEIAFGRMGIVNECNTEEELRELYKNLIIQSGFGSGYLPYQRRKDGKYKLLESLADEVEKGFIEESKRKGKMMDQITTENPPHGWIM